MKTMRQRREEKREVQLEEIRDSIAAGTLVVRKMTPKERAKYPARPRASKRRVPGQAFR
jgi:hypothetical protein